jgi:hypothetical protein
MFCSFGPGSVITAVREISTKQPDRSLLATAGFFPEGT